MKVKPRLRQLPHSTFYEWYMYIDVKVDGVPKEMRINGFGWTPQGALRDLHEALLRRNKILHRHGFSLEVELPSLPPYHEIKAPDHCLATSNLPWWKRLFRI